MFLEQEGQASIVQMKAYSPTERSDKLQSVPTTHKCKDSEPWNSAES